MSQPTPTTTTPPGPPSLGAPGHAPTEVPIGRSVPAVLASIVVAAILSDLAVQTRAGGVAACATIVVLCVSLVRAGWVVRRGGRVLLGGAAVLSTLLVLRVSPWLVVLDLVTIAVMMSLGCSAERGGRPFDTRFATVTRRLGETAGAVAIALGPLGRATASASRRHHDRTGGTGRALVRGLLIAVPIMVVLGVNLASADAVFASLFEVDLQLDRWVGHLVVLALAAWLAAGWFVQAGRPPVSHPPRALSIGAVEATVVMVGLTALYAVFAATQLLVARRGPEYVVATTGLTYADYARSGFFQLLWVAGATALVLLVLRAVVVPSGTGAARCISIAGTVAAALTLVVVHAAIGRLDLYESAFGLTLLRYASSAVAWWLGGVFVVIGAWFALGRRSARDWLPTALGLLTLATVVGLNVANPEATVMRHNLTRAAEGAEFDADYALRLSDDAVPVLVDGLGALPPEQVDLLSSELCTDRGPVRWTFPERAAADALDGLCR